MAIEPAAKPPERVPDHFASASQSVAKPDSRANRMLLLRQSTRVDLEIIIYE